MPLAPLHGHLALREQLRDAVARQTLPGSLLFQGPRGIGKQQLALWLARTLLCENADRAPCGACQSCRMASAVHHPDLHWFFPRPRLKNNSDPDLADIRADMAEGIAERLQNDGVYEASTGDEGLFVASVRAIVQTAGLAPAMGRRKVFVVGDAERLVAQEGNDMAANAFLKLLEEPAANTTIILTSSEPGALLPTIRSRVVSVRVAPLTPAEVRSFLGDPVISRQLDFAGASIDELVGLAGGAPGRLIGRDAWQASIAQAHRLLEAAATTERGALMRASLRQGASGARGKFSDTLEALTVLLHERSRSGAQDGNDPRASGAARAIEAVERAKERADGNVNPQLVTAALLREIAPLVQ